MRKSSKLLAVLLTLCLLFGTITAIVASADGETATPTLNVGDSSTLEGTSGDKTWTGNSNRTHVAKALTSTDGSALAIKYFVFDADFYVTGTTTYPLQFVPSFTYTVGAASKANQSASGLAALCIAMTEDGYSLQFGSAYNADTAFSNTLGLYNHLTYVLKVESATADSTTTYTLTASAYLNGEYVGNSVGTIATDAGTELTLTRFATKYYTKSSKVDGVTVYSINPWTGTYDSVADESKACSYTQIQGVSNYYNVGSEKTTALEAALANNANLYDSTSSAVVYNANYVTPDAATNYVTVNGTTYTLIGKAMDAIAAMTGDENTIVVSGRSLTDVTIPEGVKTFTVTLENGGTFELSDASKAWYKENNGTYTYQKQNITYTDDCDEGAYGTKSNSLNFAYNNSAKSPHVKVSYLSDSGYVRVHYNKDNNLAAAMGGDLTVSGLANMEREAEIAWRAHAYYNEATDLANMKYMTIDLDFGADAYAYTITIGDKTYYATAKTEAEALAKLTSEQGVTDTTGAVVENNGLAFPDAANVLQMRPQFQSSVSGVTDPSAEFTVSSGNKTWSMIYAKDWLWVHQVDGDWYIGTSDKSYMAKLSGEVGVFDHLTYVIEISNVDGVTSFVPHVYVNGEYLYSMSRTTETDGAAFVHFQQLTIDFGRDQRTATVGPNGEAANKKYDTTIDNPGFKMLDKYSFAFDNMAVTYYDAEDLEFTTLDDYAEDKAPLYTLENVVYNEDYVTPNPERYVEFKGDKYYVINAGFNKMSDRNSIYVYNVGEGYVPPAGFNLNSFYVYKSGEFSFDASFAEKYAAPSIETDGAYFYELLKSCVVLNGTEMTLEAALAAIKDGDVLELVRTDLEDFDKELASFTVICDTASSFTLASTFPTWKYAKIGDTYTKVIDSGILANLSLFSDRHQFKIYIPQPENGTLSGVAYYQYATGASGDTNPRFTSYTDKDGVKYLVLYWNTRMDMNGKTAYAELKYTDKDGNESTLLSRFEAVFDVPSYAKKVAETYDCGSEEAQLAKAIVDFRVELLKQFSKTTLVTAYDDFYAIYAGHTDCTCGTVVPEADYINVGAAHENLTMPEGVSVTYGVGTQYFYMYVNGTAGDIVTVSYTAAGNVAASKEETIGSTSGHASFTLIGAADIDNEFEITITRPGAEGEEATVIGSFMYSLADYDVESNADVKNLVIALKNYAIAAENYKKFIPEE